jgi:hypothetical protein
MSKINRSIVLRCMRKALHKINTSRIERGISNSEPPRYQQLLANTLAELAAEGFSIERGNDQYYTTSLMLGDSPLGILLTEGYGQLLSFGYIVSKPKPPQAPDPNWFYITEAGQQWASGSTPVPEDQQGYLEALITLVPNVDDVIRQYVQEALVTYGRQAFFASAVMIGAASEKAVYLLMDALHGAVRDPQKQKSVQDAINLRRLPTMFNLLSQYIKQAKTLKGVGAMPYSVHEGADTHLLSLQEAIRVQRNDAVHPQVGQVNHATVLLTLAAFPYACKKIYDLIDWFTANPSSL